MRSDFQEAVLTEARQRHSAFLRAERQEGFRRAAERIEKRKDRESEAEVDTGDIVQLLIFASPEAIASFEARLDLHEQAVVEALLKNQEQLDAARQEVDALLDEAHELPDGRRVFKTRDGLRVFDEDGTEVSTQDIEPELIEDGRPRWEHYKSRKDAFDSLATEREELLDYQEKLDGARDRLEGGGLTEDDLAELDSLLEDDVPEAVRRHLPPEETNAPANEDASTAIVPHAIEEQSSTPETDPRLPGSKPF